MAKVDINLVKKVLIEAGIEDGKVKNIIENINVETENAKEEREKPLKKQYVVIVSDPYGKLAATGFDYTGWIVQIPDDANPASALERLHQGVYDFNLTPKGRRLPIKTVSDACEFGAAKLYKEHKVWVKTKTPVLLVATNNKIPTSKDSKE